MIAAMVIDTTSVFYNAIIKKDTEIENKQSFFKKNAPFKNNKTAEVDSIQKCLEEYKELKNKNRKIIAEKFRQESNDE